MADHYRIAVFDSYHPYGNVMSDYDGGFSNDGPAGGCLFPLLLFICFGALSLYAVTYG